MYVLDNPLPTVLPKGSSLEECVTFEQWLEDNCKVRSIILASMTNEIQKQYDRLDDVPSIMLRMKEVYAVIVCTKSGVKMQSFIEKLEDLKTGLDNDTYIDVILQSLPPSYDPFIINYNMNGLEKTIHELVNMLVQYEATTHKSALAVLVLDIGCGAHIYNNLQVLERSRRLSKDEMILRLGDGKAIAAKVVGSLSLVISDHIRIELKDCYYVSRKITKKPFVIQSAIANGLLDLVHTNVCGPLNTPARGGYSSFITFTDDHSRYGYVYLMKYKSEAFRRFKEYRLEVENQIGYKIKTFCRAEDEVLLEESSEAPQHDNATSFEPLVPTDGVPVLCRSTRESRPPERYGFVGCQLDNDPRTYGEAMLDIDSDKWLEATKFKMDSMGSNQVWTLVDPPKGVRPVGCKRVYKHKLGADGEVTTFKARIVAKGYTQQPPRSILRKPIRM
ncbi:UNVERIFIED_CONTAM: hypothetical protein Sradi_3249600 [Sesamum radiatum]|uniref:Reverse transcriptase Ty1/copia-type domain-containing protein n=1 Tax=Sesamum radiatum TaxID=300843 RepID=A0AAW2R0I1_SESRA